MSNIDNTSTIKADVYQKVTDAIVNAIEQGVSSWKMPWHTSGRYAFSPINVTSKKPYRGVNTLCLWASAESKGYESGEWGTYKQWQERGGQVRKGEKSTTVVFWKFANESAESQDDGEHSASSSRLIFTRGSQGPGCQYIKKGPIPPIALIRCRPDVGLRPIVEELTCCFSGPE